MQRVLGILPFIVSACKASCEGDAVCSNVLLQTRHLNSGEYPSREGPLRDLNSLLIDGLVRQRGFKRRTLAKSVGLVDLAAPKKMFFFTHHKSGTVLARDLANELASVLGEDHTAYEWASWEEEKRGYLPGCAETNVATYQNMNKDMLIKVQNSSECSGFRSVHFIREAAAITVSAYLYHSELEHKDDHVMSAPDGYEILNAMNTSMGLLQEAEVQVNYTLKDMAEVHLGLADDLNSLVVGLEEFDTDYEATTRKIFEWMLGSNHSKISELVEKASEYDTSQWTAGDDVSDHLSDKSKTNETLDLFLELHSESIIQKVLNFDQKLGYDAPSL